MPHRLVRTADGFRGTFLFLVGLMFLPTSIAYAADQRPLAAVNPGLEGLPEVIRVWHLGVVFVVSLLVATVIGLFSRRLSRWPNLIGWGFVAALVPPVVATALPLVALFYGASVSLIWTTIWPNLVLSSAIYLGSEWPNPATFLNVPPSAPSPPAPEDV